MTSQSEDAANNWIMELAEKEVTDMENTRLELLDKVSKFLKESFKNTSVEIYAVGSLIYPYQFTAYSDIDIVVKNLTVTKKEVWSKLESELGREVEVMLFEKSLFPESILTNGLKIV